MKRAIIMDEQIEQILDQMTRKQRRVVFLRSHGRTYKYIGYKMGISETSARRLHLRAKKKAETIQAETTR